MISSRAGDETRLDCFGCRGLSEALEPVKDGEHGSTTEVQRHTFLAELKERETRMVVDARQDPATRPRVLKRIAGQLDVHPEALRTLGHTHRGRLRRPSGHHDQ
ncbi:hypothetical protein F6X56_01045 (plasmid) [Rhodococcus erythropolis]|uniref:hypothetical protein n=1 Tax=Rhodococcus TaxID=1827 RepID=UPI001248DCF6|nr:MULTISPECIES: hypothetical protein [Rhodococcus]MCJ0949848.1 hypothetical protein [Rhodococcus sp. ARC_M8]MDJ0441001.1 hypothetical protein [Rhodococcus qingshengii]QEX08379.1 hypothetical protein F6X56_01045 [Rhodococcus erythropolis]QOS66455.1 hypothetical protein IM699_30435 [Rhodococcus qingshengii]